MLVHDNLKIFSVDLPLPSPLNQINCYAIKGASGWSIIDCGLDSSESRLVWREFMAKNRIRDYDIIGIYLTHWHPDHSQAAGWLQEVSGAPVYISAPDAAAIERTSQISHENIDLLIKNGMPPNFSSERIVKTTNKPVKITVIKPGETVWLGDFNYSIIYTPGHSDGHMCYFNEKFGVLFSGDHVLRDITPNISLWKGFAPNPLSNYLKSLLLMYDLPCRLVLPSHGESFSNLKERTCQLETHHSNQLKRMKNIAEQGATAFEVCNRVFGLNVNLKLAMGETYAHLMYLVYKEELQLTEKDGLNFFCR